ncbi:MAG: hypothetical protein KDA41_19015, partial [Planctomycetales bacterium]|nr:hypothetical protein [Planctomycetales bacterium]
KVADPILSGDLLFTPLWQPGENRRFALAGVLDIDGDGDDDSATLRAMIEKTKGTIEAAVAADGRRTGKLTPATRYLVVGEAPSGAGSEAIESYGQLLREARELGIDQISPSKLLDLVGQGSGRVVRLGPERSRAATGRPERTPSAY